MRYAYVRTNSLYHEMISETLVEVSNPVTIYKTDVMISHPVPNDTFDFKQSYKG